MQQNADSWIPRRARGQALLQQPMLLGLIWTWRYVHKTENSYKFITKQKLTTIGVFLGFGRGGAESYVYKK